MALYEIGFILVRCHIQKRLSLGGHVEAIPLGATGFAGDIHTARGLLSSSGFNFTRSNLDSALTNFRDTGHAALLKMPEIEASTFQEAIERSEAAIPSALGALAVVSANPVVQLCAYAKSPSDSGVKFYVPPDRKILHCTNIAGFLDALPDIEAAAKHDSKLNLLLRLYRASLRELDIDYQLLFQLILFEEASDGESGSLAERVRKFSEKHGFSNDLNVVAQECGLSIPLGKDMVDVIVKLRNAAAHNGKIDADSLKEYGGDWVIPLLTDKSKLHRAVGEAIRYMFCALVGHTRDAKATLVTGSLEMRFD
jgi:hypothetical protein